jgi:DNA-directed RNA polymerase specialized sigma24 family protein
LKRGGDAAPPPDAGPEEEPVDPALPPDLLVLMTEQCQHLLDLLGDDELRALALCKLEGFTDDEAAETMGCARRTIQRRLTLIRRLWQEGEGGTV